MIKIMYEDQLIGEIITNQSLNINQALDMINFNEDQFIADNGFDAIDYNDFKLIY